MARHVEHHPCQEPLPTEIERVWVAAGDDAGIPPSESVLVLLAGNALQDGGIHSCYLPRGRAAHPDISVELMDRLNGLAQDCVRAHRVLLGSGRPLEVNAALMRHELEHARQFEAEPRTYDLHELAEEVVTLDRDNSGRLYNAMPAERDANAAAAVFARGLFGSDRIDEFMQRPEHAALLRRANPPPAPAGLSDRTLEFLASIPELCTLCARNGGADSDPVGAFARFLDRAYGPGGGDRWRQLL